jgi:hypothetical protein
LDALTALTTLCCARKVKLDGLDCRLRVFRAQWAQRVHVRVLTQQALRASVRLEVDARTDSGKCDVEIVSKTSAGLFCTSELDLICVLRQAVRADEVAVESSLIAVDLL